MAKENMGGSWVRSLLKMVKIFARFLLKKVTQLNIGVAKRQKYGVIIKMKTSQEGIELIKKFEGLELEAYRCAADVLTIGYGHTEGVKEGDTIEAAEAEQILKNDLCIYEEAVENAVTAPLSQHQFDALVAWTFNLGAGNLSSSTMLRVLNEGKYEEVPHQMKRWNKAGGQVLEGLVRRRQAEALLFEGQEWHNV